MRSPGTLEEMKEKNGLKSAPKFVFWISFFCVIFVCIALTSDALGYRLPVFASDKIYVLNYTQPVPGIYIAENSSRFGNDSSKVVPMRRKNNITVQSNSSIIVTPRRKLQTHVAFLKVHKAGSTTMQNLFFRFGLKHKLNILLAKSGNYIFSHTAKVPLNTGEHFDIFACHTVYSKTWFDSLLPADSDRLGIVREPISRMISSAYYYRDVWGVGYLKKVPPANFIHNLVNYPEKYEKSFFSRTRNSMGKDFGFPGKIKAEDKEKIRKYLDDLNSEFSLVMVMEKFDESLVLMKRVLNWSFSDILYLKTNAYKHSPVVLNQTEKAKFRQTSFLDFEIYEYFTDIFETKLKEADNNFEDEVAFFQTVLDKVSEFCSISNKAVKPLIIQSSKWDGEFQVSNSDCDWMKTKELPFISKLHKNNLYHHGGA